MKNNTILKQATQNLHDNVERVMNSSLLFNNQFTPKHYINFITKSYSYICMITDITSLNWPEYEPILTSKKQALVNDLKHLEIQSEISQLKQYNQHDPYYQLGLIYIVLGAMLGNKIILSKLKQSPNFLNYPFNYLSSHQEDLPLLWKNFQEKINSITETELKQVIEGAKIGYSLFGE